MVAAGGLPVGRAVVGNRSVGRFGNGRLRIGGLGGGVSAVGWPRSGVPGGGVAGRGCPGRLLRSRQLRSHQLCRVDGRGRGLHPGGGHRGRVRCGKGRHPRGKDGAGRQQQPEGPARRRCRSGGGERTTREHVDGCFGHWRGLAAERGGASLMAYPLRLSVCRQHRLCHPLPTARLHILVLAPAIPAAEYPALAIRRDRNSPVKHGQ
ncbi:hypothetical protein [Azospirillum endophyticum]